MALCHVRQYRRSEPETGERRVVVGALANEGQGLSLRLADHSGLGSEGLGPLPSRHIGPNGQVILPGLAR